VPPFPATGYVSTEILESTERKIRTKWCAEDVDPEGKRNLSGLPKTRNFFLVFAVVCNVPAP